MGRKYRKRHSAAGSIIVDSTYIGSRLTWWGALCFGLVTFILFYYIVPTWLGGKLSDNHSSTFYPALETLLGRRIYWFKWLGVACAFIFGYYSIRNYLISSASSNLERGLVGLISRILGRHI